MWCIGTVMLLHFAYARFNVVVHSVAATGNHSGTVLIVQQMQQSSVVRAAHCSLVGVHAGLACNSVATNKGRNEGWVT